MHAHIQFIARLLNRAPKIRFFLDQESGLRAAFLATFKARVKARTADAFYVRVLKDATVDVKRNKVRKAQLKFLNAQAARPGLSEREVERLLMKEKILRAPAFGKWDDKWVNHPIPDMREPEKQICWLTGFGELDEDHVANLYLKATLLPVDRFFMQVRRGITMAERGIVSSSAGGRAWFGKNAHNPGNLAKLLEIFSVYFNYCEIGEYGKNPSNANGASSWPRRIGGHSLLY